MPRTGIMQHRLFDGRAGRQWAGGKKQLVPRAWNMRRLFHSEVLKRDDFPLSLRKPAAVRVTEAARELNCFAKVHADLLRFVRIGTECYRHSHLRSHS